MQGRSARQHLQGGQLLDSSSDMSLSENKITLKRYTLPQPSSGPLGHPNLGRNTGQPRILKGRVPSI